MPTTYLLVCYGHYDWFAGFNISMHPPHLPSSFQLRNPGGMGGMEILKQHLEVATDLATKGLVPGEVYHSVDIDGTCQRVLLGHGPVHVFKDLLQTLTLPARLAVQRVMAQNELLVKDLHAKSQEAMTDKLKREAKTALKEAGNKLLKSLMDTMDAFPATDLFEATSACYKHPNSDGQCHVFPDSDPSQKEYFMAGTSCTDWSSMGTQTSLAGSTVLPFAVELQMVKRRRPRVFFHECTRNFRPSILQEYLPGFWIANCLVPSGTKKYVISDLLTPFDPMAQCLALARSCRAKKTHTHTYTQTYTHTHIYIYCSIELKPTLV